MRDQTQRENAEYSSYLDSMIKNDAIQNVRVKLNLGLPWKSSIQQQKGSFYQQIGLKYNGQTNQVLHLEHSFVWC
jgi:hypothetical protein